MLATWEKFYYIYEYSNHKIGKMLCQGENMNKIKFVLPAVAVLSIAFILSCSNVENAVQQSQCTANQGEWDATLKKCIKCPDGTDMSDGQCVSTTTVTTIIQEDGTITIICPARTKLNESRTACVADIVVVDPNAATGKFYCDYGKLDSLAVDWHDDCVEIQYQSECDNDWGRLVPSCQAKDRRTDFVYCDFGPGECYWVLKDSDCDTEWGIVASQCGTHGKYPNGTVCPAGKSEVLNECRKTSDIGDRNSIYCDYGPFTLNNLDELEGGCWEIQDWEGNSAKTAENRTNCLKWGKGVNTCPVYSCPAGWLKTEWGGCEKDPNVKPSSSSVTKSSSSSVIKSSSSGASGSAFFCDYGYVSSTDADLQLSEGGGCFEIETESECNLEWGKLVRSCNAVDRRNDLEYCDYGPWNQWGGGCFRINSQAERDNCLEGVIKGYAEIVSICAWLN